MTLEQLRNQLSAIEPDESTFEGIGPSEIPLLEQLLHDEEAWIASRAIFALSRIADNEAVKILSRAVTDPRPEVKVAVAASVGNLKSEDSNDILLKLLNDTNLGVRKFAIQSVSDTHNAVIHTKLRELETRDPAPPIRDIAKSKLQELKLNGP
jgi:HEAT repeat protein